MPDWSPEIANDFISLATGEGRCLDQMQLQKLVYIANGWCLARYGCPLSLDRPEAWSFGPVFARLARSLEHYGLQSVMRLITSAEANGVTFWKTLPR